MFTPLLEKNETDLIGSGKSNEKTKVVVAMSGGVDSSVAASIIKEHGYDVVGITLQLFDYGKIGKTKGTCCAGKDIYDAKKVCDKIKIEHQVMNYEDIFNDEVIEKFADSYIKGETPIPCIDCNQTVKFRDLFKFAKKLNADALVTGHYVKRIDKEYPKMYRPNDLDRDQSYFLFSTTQEQLEYLRFPLANLSKKETREIAKKMNLIVANKPDSQDICFVPSGNYKKIIEKLRPESFKKGNIVDKNGKILGYHNGIVNYTIGQRKGIKISNSEPLFVMKLDTNKNEVVVGNKKDLLVNKIFLRDLNFLTRNKEDLNNNIMVKVRSTGKLLNCKFNNVRNEILLDKGEEGVSPGQACVFYKEDSDGTRVLGGGWIKKTEN
jgi:tRNA-specific 2-thiouridylase|tara:strand:- start:537 stop:1673 length:1137 start_codon:yes stop_codon:yes gene_type:complete